MIRTSMLVVLFAAALGAVVGAPGLGAQAPTQQKYSDRNSDAIPRESRPPAGMCRIWVDGVPAAQQPAPTDCPSAVKNKPPNGRVIYGEDRDKGKGKNSVDRLPVRSLIKPLERKIPPLMPPEQS